MKSFKLTALAESIIADSSKENRLISASRSYDLASLTDQDCKDLIEQNPGCPYIKPLKKAAAK